MSSYAAGTELKRTECERVRKVEIIKYPLCAGSVRIPSETGAKNVGA